jgi:hypothetical protein
MREDMSKVIVERPRMRIPKPYRSHYPRASLRSAWRDDDDAPRREGMGRGYRYKWLNENLAPLQRFLRSRVGRPWDKVFSEMSRHISLDSAVKKHVLQHLHEFVAQKTREIDGQLYEIDLYGRVVPFWQNRRRARLYVCSRTGLLRLFENPRRLPKAPRFPGRAIDADHDVRKIDGTWYLVRFAPMPSSWEQRIQTYDVVLKGNLPFQLSRYGVVNELWGRQDRYACELRPLKRKEYRRLLGG